MGTWDIDLVNDSIVCSPEMLTLWGIDPHTFKGDRALLQSKVNPNDRQIMIDAIKYAIANREVYELEYRIHPTPGETKWVVSRGRCKYIGNDGKAIRFAGVVYDITDKRQKDEEIATAIRARDSFFMVAGHELRTPLACLHLQIEVLNWELKNNHPTAFADENVMQGLRKQQEHIFRVSQIVDNILSEARSSKKSELSLQSESMDLQELIRDILDRIRVAADAQSTSIEIAYSEKVVGFWDRSRIEQVIINLLTNALKYGNRKPIALELRKMDRLAVFTVRDQGIGIAPEFQDRIFEQFERVINSQRITGMGIGLYISRKITRAHGGDITVRSELGQGAEFTMKLPLAP